MPYRQRVLLLCLTAAWLISLTGNVILYNTSYHYYTGLNATRLEPVLQRYESD